MTRSRYVSEVRRRERRKLISLLICYVGPAVIVIVFLAIAIERLERKLSPQPTEFSTTVNQ